MTPPRGRRVVDDTGAMAVILALLMPVLLALCALAIDIASWYVEAMKVQKTADAASMAGVTFMPQDFASATTAALDMASDNGYPASKVAVSKNDSSGAPLPPSQLRVTVTNTVPTFFGVILGRTAQTISRSAIADFQAPAIMGNPCNTFGNEPPSNAGAALPAGSALPASGGFATCTSTPQYWATMQGPATDKLQGDRYSTRVCSNGVDNCSGGVNSEYKQDGYYFVVRVQPAAVNTAVALQVFDPAHVYTGTTCDQLPSSGITNGMNPYAPDASTRYARSSGQYCPGDYDPGGSGTPPRLDTTFALREQIDTLRPQDAAPISGCIKQFRGYSSPPTANQLKASNASYNRALAQVLHNWVQLCSFTPTRQGDYYLQVRTNVGAFGTGEANTNGNAAGVYSGTPAQYLSAPTSTTGRGDNSFAMRAVTAPGVSGTAISIAGWERMPVFANGTAAQSTFNLIRVTPSSAGQSMSFAYFDVGDAASSGTVQVLMPVGATGSLGTCVAKGPGNSTRTLTNCTATISNSTHNGKVQTIIVPIPTNYSCDATSPGGCWFRVRVSFSSGAVNDITTWDASLQGDPVRLVS